MLEKFFDSSVGGLARVRSLRNGPHGLLLDDFSKELFQTRYFIDACDLRPFEQCADAVKRPTGKESAHLHGFIAKKQRLLRRTVG